MSTRVRTGIALGEAARTRIAELAQMAGLSQNGAIESLILGITDEQAQAIIARGNAFLRSEKRTRLDQNRAMRTALDALTPEQRQALLEQAKNAGGA